jgi:hypothetical protein
MVIRLAEAFRVNHSRKFIRKFQHGIFRQIRPPCVNQFVKQNIQKFFAVKRMRDSDCARSVATVTVSIGRDAAAFQLPPIPPNVDRAFLARHAGNCPGVLLVVYRTTLPKLPSV